ncbi:hypothetical protein DRO66_01315 [Candidatus Bathyarchaeota archaeon]|nr:MAG: hypothetical protein DRO66_01315 [Candidatus Bathyarchaeota archaeon]
MTEFLIGAGGWAYFQVPGLRPLEAYSRAFSFVEVNSTFYTNPSFQLVKSWRRRVPQKFEFSVRCHQDVTHRFMLEPIREVFDNVTRMLDVCRILRSKFLVLQTPASFPFTEEKIEAIRHLFNSLNLKGIRLVWEVRRRGGECLPRSLRSLMQDFNVIQCIDLSRETLATDVDTVYSRVFGKGEHNIYQFTDGELLEINRKIMDERRDTAVVSFHNVRMYKDAARYKIYKQRKKFPPVTRYTGQLALKEVLTEDTDFPATKQKLITTQGWKVIDLPGDQRVHAHTFLKRLPDKCFKNIEEVMLKLHQKTDNTVTTR